uniref:Uncharacterized protein n=1 Tax=Angiostrongylus cantonensis TaxID=6313 RepID=A0A0K0D523_ANGCA
MIISYSGLLGNHKEVTQQLANLDENDVVVRKLKNQLNRFGGLDEDMEKVHDRIRDKVKKQIPKDLNKLSARTDNIMQQLHSRLDKDEEERIFAIKELQEVFQKLQSLGHLAENETKIRRDIDECKIAIKKLAESVTTVKNVLEKKITEQSRM